MLDSIMFPNPDHADSDGLIAYGGDLSVETLINAYSHGIFPWYSENEPILWWSPDPRMVLFLDKLHISRRVLRKLKKRDYENRIDTCFETVIKKCASVKRKGQPEGTWITDEMIDAYINLHNMGYAHSIETFSNKKLVGGLYGISLGKAFFGESMFHIVSDASKIALYYLVEKLKEFNFHFIDTQQVTNHMKSMGAEEIKRSEFLSLLKEALSFKAIIGKWS